MSLVPSLPERLSRARSDLRMGLPVILVGEGGAALAAAAETLGAERLADLRALGAPVLAITRRRADTLRARAYSAHVARVVLPDAADVGWIRAVADPADDLKVPLKGPLETGRGGDESLARTAVALAKSARLLPAMVLVPLADGTVLSEHTGLTRLPAAAVDALMGDVPDVAEAIAARLPVEASERARLRVFRPGDGGEEHYAVEIGRPSRDRPVLARLHSACFTGDVLGSLKCDCGPQLRAALAQMGAEGEGVLLYLNQEGRGIGLANKMRAYSLQDQGFDTVEANHRLGFEDDERDFRIGAEMLRGMGFARVRLLTNNPAKVERLSACGIEVVERVPLKVGETRFNHHYLATKAKKSGHLL
ncbi:GTP cyclohydrolase II [Wenxinia marina]|uniref:GTP cyclohydrolase-2 n=1 Tax=Wenxinia marina DSM 24838 TaxID=1123501 RepID=A0A0D0QH32_9RHOB|nr:GTP cyclohydrolase II [Wenxinia marina]KIQ70368.1 GTP cyclohydrolase II [Wenxinia marina DSM 24838]GGL53705.1 GTP cyclohydrolase-2 [Wenxinia marina]